MSRIEGIRSRTVQQDQDGNTLEMPTEIHLPECPPSLEYLLAFFYAAGQAMQTSAGLVPLTWQEIRAFREESAHGICSWESDLLRRMSEVYCAEAVAAKDPLRPAPYKPAATEIDGVEKARNIRESFLSAFRKK